MKKNRKTLMLTSILIMAVIWGFIAVKKGTNLFGTLELFIFIAIIILSVIAFLMALKKDKEAKLGLPAEDELSTQLKYKAGYYAYLSSMYMWLAIFIMKDNFPDIETMLGGGILLSAVLAVISKLIVKYRLND